MKAIFGGDLHIRAQRAHAGGADGDRLAVLYDSSRYRRQLVLHAKGFEIRGEVVGVGGVDACRNGEAQCEHRRHPCRKSARHRHVSLS